MASGTVGEKRAKPGKLRHHSDAAGIDGLATRHDLIQQNFTVSFNSNLSPTLVLRLVWLRDSVIAVAGWGGHMRNSGSSSEFPLSLTLHLLCLLTFPSHGEHGALNLPLSHPSGTTVTLRAQGGRLGVQDQAER